MSAKADIAVATGKRTLKLRHGGLVALGVLEKCPFVPVDAFVHFAGLGAHSSAYQQLARLRRAGLAEVHRVDPGYLIGERRLGCWTITDKGRRLLCAADGQKSGEHACVPQLTPGIRGPHKPWRIGDGDASLLIASYRLLASIVLDCGSGERAVEIQQWEWPWLREVWSEGEGKLVRISMPAGATLKAHNASTGDQLMSVVLVTDLGTAPVVRYREKLRRLVALRRELQFGGGSDDAEPEIVVGTPDADCTGARSKVWRELIERIVEREGELPLRARVVSWNRIAEKLGPARCTEVVDNDRRRCGEREKTTATVLRQRAPARIREQLLHVIGRHPLLTVDQLARLLGTAADRVRRLENELIGEGLLRVVGLEELPPGGTGTTREEFSALGLVEVTRLGGRRVAGWFGLRTAAATRYHGVSGSGRSGARRRWRLLRALTHSLGANNVFVELASAAEAVRRAGGDDVLAEWRSAAACERRHCKPDSYGCYVRNGVAHGLFLEYDRGTERSRKYAAKFRAYYRYRDSGQAARDYDGFPTLLFITTKQVAEDRIAEQAYRAWFIRSSEPLPILITTEARIAAHPEGILGPIWRVPSSTTSTCCPKRHYWLNRGPNRPLCSGGGDAAPGPAGRMAHRSPGAHPRSDCLRNDEFVRREHR